jgi:hypothetical protein
VPDAVEHAREGGDDKPAAGHRDRPRNGEGKREEAERRSEDGAKRRRERDVRERERREEVHRVDEDVRWREEVLERMREVPLTIPTEADAEREEVEEDREPDRAVCHIDVAR